MNKTEAKRLLTMGNHKLGGKIASWSLPATKEVCGRVCVGCYAEKAQRIYPAVTPSRERKLDIANSAGFAGNMTKAIEVLEPDYIRIHDSGEFYSQNYVDNWEKIVKTLPKYKFYAYTKRLDDFSFDKLKAHSNIVIINSLHNGSLNYGPKDKRPKDMFLCPDYKGSPERIITPKGPICGTLCSYCMTKTAETTGVYFVKH